MFGRRYLGGRYFGPRYFGDGSDTAPPAPDCPTTAQIVAAVMAYEIEAGVTVEAALRIILAAVSGRTTGVGTTTERYLSVNGALARITATFDGDSNRTSVTLDGT